MLQCLAKKKNVVINLPVGQLFFSSAGTVEFKSIPAREMDTAGRSLAASVTETSVRGSHRGQARLYGRAGNAAGSKSRLFGARTPFKSSKPPQAGERGPRDGGAGDDGQENYSYLSDFLRSQIDMQKAAADPRSTVNILQYNRKTTGKYNN